MMDDCQAEWSSLLPSESSADTLVIVLYCLCYIPEMPVSGNNVAANLALEVSRGYDLAGPFMSVRS